MSNNKPPKVKTTDVKVRINIADKETPFDVADAAAMQALVIGQASPEQQVRAIEWIVNEASGFNDISFHAENNMTAFCEGKRFVASQIRKLVNISLSAITKSTKPREQG